MFNWTTLPGMPTSDEAIAKINEAVESARAAANRLADAMTEFTSSKAGVAESQLSESAAKASDIANTAVAAAQDQLDKALASVKSAAQAAADKVTSAIPKSE